LQAKEDSSVKRSPAITHAINEVVSVFFLVPIYEVLRGGCVSVTGNSLFTSARYARRWRGDGDVVAFRRQDQVRQPKDT
jgi:hypothetical protein